MKLIDYVITCNLVNSHSENLLFKYLNKSRYSSDDFI